MINFKQLKLKDLQKSFNKEIQIKFQGNCFCLIKNEKVIEIGRSLKELFENILFYNINTKTLDIKHLQNF